MCDVLHGMIMQKKNLFWGGVLSVLFWGGPHLTVGPRKRYNRIDLKK